MEEIKAEILKAAASGELDLDPVQQIILVMGPNNHLWINDLHSMRIHKNKIDRILENAGFEQIQCSNGSSKYQRKIENLLKKLVRKPFHNFFQFQRIGPVGSSCTFSHGC